MTDSRDPMVNVLANCLDAIEQGDISPAECLRCYPQHQGELWIMLQVVDILQHPPPIPMRPTFRQGARQRLIGKIAPPPPVPLSARIGDWWRERSWMRWQVTPRPRMARAVVGLLLMVAAALASMGGVVVAANDSLPGGRLYPIKLAIEDARLIILSDSGDARLHLELAERRVEEIGALANRGQYEEAVATVQRYEHHIAGATRAVNRIAAYDTETAGELMALLDQVLFRTHEELCELVATAPPDYRRVFQTAADVSREYRIVLATLYPWEVTGDNRATRMPAGEPTEGIVPLLPVPPTVTWTAEPAEENPSLATAVTAETLTPGVGVPGYPTATPVPGQTGTPIPIGSAVPSSTPTPVPLPQPSEPATPYPATWTPAPTQAPLPTSTASATSAPLPTSTPTPTATEIPGEPTHYPPGLTKTAQPPGLTVPPGLTMTPEPPGLTKTPKE